MDSTRPGPGAFKLLGGRLALNFANTVDWHASEQPVEFLTSYAELVAWSVQAQILTRSQGDALLEDAARRPAEARAVLDRAIPLREAIYRIFSAISAGQRPQAPDLARLNAELAAAMGQARLVVASGGFAWDWTPVEGRLDWVLWPVVHDAANLLTSDQLRRVGQCADDGCGWLFLDTSRNRSRRWCSMQDCGNRAKARRHYERSRVRREPVPR